MKFKVGDKVRVRRFSWKVYDLCYFENLMAELKGKVVEIEDLDIDSLSRKMHIQIIGQKKCLVDLKSQKINPTNCKKC